MRIILTIFIALTLVLHVVAQDHVVETIQLYGFDEGAAIIKGNDWQILTKTTYKAIENSFSTPIPSGYTREYYLGFRRADNISDCASTGMQLRFWFTWSARAGHYFTIDKNWGSHQEGDYYWVKVPGSDLQKNTLGIVNGYWRLDARIPASCNGNISYVYGVYLKAIDRSSGSQPAIVANNDPQGYVPAHRSIGLGDGIINKEGRFAIGKDSPDASLDIYSQSPNAGNLILAANYHDRYRWRFRTIDRGNAIDLDITASDGSDVQEPVLKLSRSTSGRPEFAINENWLVANNGNVGIGTTNPNQKLTVNGTIYGKEVKVDLNVPGPDYVFEPTYNLPSLTEIETYIKANKHLPEVPSAKEMEANGINLSEMNMLLLKKVEELTLYLIEMKKENTVMRSELDELKRR
jgi:hypothetical protein